jgi:hypothetical protein
MRIIACRVQIMEENIYFLLLYYFLFIQYLYADQSKCHISMVMGNATANVALATPSLARLSGDIAPWTTLPRQHHR